MVISWHSPKCRGGIVSTIADAETGSAFLPLGVAEVQLLPGVGRVGSLFRAFKVFPGGIIADEALAPG